MPAKVVYSCLFELKPQGVFTILLFIPNNFENTLKPL